MAYTISDTEFDESGILGHECFIITCDYEGKKKAVTFIFADFRDNEVNPDRKDSALTLHKGEKNIIYQHYPEYHTNLQALTIDEFIEQVGLNADDEIELVGDMKNIKNLSYDDNGEVDGFYQDGIKFYRGRYIQKGEITSFQGHDMYPLNWVCKRLHDYGTDISAEDPESQHEVDSHDYSKGLASQCYLIKRNGETETPYRGFVFAPNAQNAMYYYLISEESNILGDNTGFVQYTEEELNNNPSLEFDYAGSEWADENLTVELLDDLVHDNSVDSVSFIPSQLLTYQLGIKVTSGYGTPVLDTNVPGIAFDEDMNAYCTIEESEDIFQERERKNALKAIEECLAQKDAYVLRDFVFDTEDTSRLKSFNMGYYSDSDFIVTVKFTKNDNIWLHEVVE